MERSRGDMEPISKVAVREFCNENNIKIKELAQIAGYSTGCNLSRAILNGYVKSEAVYNICKFFDLPRNYFEGGHAGTGDVAKVAEAKPKEAYSPTITNWDVANELMEFHGYDNYTDLFVALVKEDYERHKKEILAKRLENMSKEELIAELMKKMSA